MRVNAFIGNPDKEMEAQTKKNILIAIWVTLGLILLAGGGWLFYFKSQFGVYEDRAYRFSIKYPQDWKVVRAPQPSVAASFISPKETAVDFFQANFNVTVQPTPSKYATLDSFSDKIVQQMTAVFKTSINIVENKPVQLGNRRGRRMIFEAPQPDAMKVLIVWAIRGEDAYIITFITKMNKYAKYDPLIEESLRSFQFK